MKVILIEVASINGKITRGLEGNIYEWSSEEDREFFFKMRDEHDLIVMGSGTFEAVKDLILASLVSGKLRIVMTKSPEEFKEYEQENILEFSAETPEELVTSLSGKYKQMLLVGGSSLASSFIEEGLIDEIYLTLEPVAFGSGKPVFADGNFETNLELVSTKKLNKQGTLLLKYKVTR